jgi:hypothetical protein
MASPNRNRVIVSDHGRRLVDQDLQICRRSLRRRVVAKAAKLPAPVVVAPRQDLVSGWRRRDPRSYLALEPGLLLFWRVHPQERANSIGADVARDDEEITRRDFRRMTVLIAERDNPHVWSAVNVASSRDK